MQELQSDDIGSNEALFEALALLASTKRGKLRRNSGKRRSTDIKNEDTIHESEEELHHSCNKKTRGT